MRLFALSAVVMAAFAANSLLNRAAVGGGLIEAMPFALVRVIAGALVLAALARVWPGWRHLAPALWLSLYLVGFSLAYRQLDAGIGALILFAAVQATMLAGALIQGERIGAARLAGAGLALAGLAALVWPGTGAVPALAPALVMAGAGIGWGLYSLAGRGSAAPLADTAANFALAVPLVALATVPAGWGTPQPGGIALAVIGGAVTSGLGYALWYAVLPRLGVARGAAVQLSVPVLALVAGAALLGEAPGPLTLVTCAIILTGVALAMRPTR